MEEEDVVKKYCFEGWGEKIAPWGLRFGRGIDKEGVGKKQRKGWGYDPQRNYVRVFYLPYKSKKQ